MKEYFDIRDWEGRRTGEQQERQLVHQTGLIHGTTHIWIFRRNQKTGSADVLLQKRSLQKDSFPGLYDTSAAGHIPAGADFLESGLRELKEELGITARPEELQYLFLHRQEVDTEFYGQRFYDRQVSAVYLLVRAVDEKELQLQKEEVDSVRWMDMDECMDRVGKKDPAFCIHPEEFRKKVLGVLSPTWNEDCLTELDEWIEEQGVYLRQ